MTGPMLRFETSMLRNVTLFQRAFGHRPTRRLPTPCTRRSRHAACAWPSVEVSTTYRRREPEKTVLYETVRDHLESFLEYADSRNPGGAPLPKYVRQAFRRFLKCGILQHGFARVRCRACGFDSLVAFSCKERSICPSCSSRRMADMAAHLVDHVVPRVPVRQWVLSLPRPMRYLLARDAGLLSGSLRIFAQEIFRHLRRASGLKPVRQALPGGVTAVQRFGGALNLNIHFHSLILDGVYGRDPAGKLVFRRCPVPTDAELDRVLKRTARRIVGFLRKAGFHFEMDGTVAEEGNESPSLFDWIQGAAIREWLTLDGSPRPVPVVGRRPGPFEIRPPGKLTARWMGFSLHAGVRIKARDREGLEKLCRYALRPAFSGERLEKLQDGRIAYGFRQPRADGSTHVILSPLELLEKLAALVPPPRAHLVVYHGVLGPHSKVRREVVPPEEADPGRCDNHKAGSGRPRRGKRKRLDWATLMRRTFAMDVLDCPRCHGRMKVIALIDEPEAIRRILVSRGLPTEAPRAAPARPPPGQQRFEFDQPEGDQVACRAPRNYFLK